MTPRGWSIVAGVLVAVFTVTGVTAYRAGRRAERVDAHAKILHDSLQHNAQELRTTGALLDAERRTRVAEAVKDSMLRAQRAVARGKLRVLNDSQFVVVGSSRDSAGAVVEVVGPTVQIPEVVALIRRDDAVVVQDSIAGRAQAAENQTLYRRDTLHVEREHLQDEVIQETKPQRCGRRCGFVAGVTVALAATHPAQVVKAVAWVIRLVR